MKIIKRILQFVLGVLLLTTLIIVLFFRQETYQLYKVLTFFEADKISENFRTVKDIFPTSTVEKSDKPYSIPTSSNGISLPTTFKFGDSTVATQSYLDHVLTDAFLVIQNDSVRFEYYSNGFKADDVHISWSMSKSVVSALIGIAIDEGHIKSIEQTVTDYLPDFAGTGYDGVRIKDVLQMSSGVLFNEDYGDFNSDINVMGRYFALGMPMSDFAKRLKRDKEPGTYNHYVSIDTQVLGMILVKATGRSITDYMKEKLWDPMGATSDAHWIVDNTGMEFALGGLNITTRDYARLGMLFLDSGRWQGKQIVPEAWVRASITPDATHLMPGKRTSASHTDGYGFQWWIPEGAEDEFNAQGIYTQFIYVDPDKDMVIVKLSSNYRFKDDRDGYYHDHEIALYRTIAERLNNQ
jgi:CubicO group peptidase (beta-lactamase class C family)